MLGEHLKQVRQNKNITQEDVAKRLYITRQTLSRWEQGKTLPNIYALKKLSLIYQINLDDLVNGKSNLNERSNNKDSFKNINYFALFGALLFNIFLFSIVTFITFVVVTSLWGGAIVFIVSPILFFIFVMLNMQKYETSQLLIVIGFSFLGLGLLVLAKKATKNLYEYFKMYIKYNHKTIFLNVKEKNYD